jgi:hypothetical protein
MRELKLTYREVSVKNPKTHSKGFFDRIFGRPFMREQFKKWSVHGLVPIILGAAVVIEQPSAIQIRSAAVMVCAAWLAIDIGIEISERNWDARVKGIVFSVLSGLIFCAGIGLMYSFLNSMLENQREETFNGLEGRIDLAPSKINLDSTYTITNNSRNEIGRHVLFCKIVSGEGPHTIIKNGSELFSSESDQPIEPGKDGETEQCVNGPDFQAYVGPDESLACMDVEFGIQYRLTNQPDIVREKRFRYVSDVGMDYQWRQERLKRKGSRCDKLRFPHPQMPN